MLRTFAFVLLFSLSGCAASHRQLYELPPARQPVASMPADFSGSWERDYSRGMDVGRTLQLMFRGLGPSAQDRNYRSGASQGLSQRQARKLVEMARFADEITDQDVLTITQDEHEIIIAREDDYNLLCGFFDGAARPTSSPYGEELCGWDGNQLVSNLTLPDGLLVRQRFTISEDRDHLRVTATIASKDSRTPFTLQRFYRRFVPAESDFNCIETFSMKRVCSTGELAP